MLIKSKLLTSCSIQQELLQSKTQIWLKFTCKSSTMILEDILLGHFSKSKRVALKPQFNPTMLQVLDFGYHEIVLDCLSYYHSYPFIFISNSYLFIIYSAMSLSIKAKPLILVGCEGSGRSAISYHLIRKFPNKFQRVISHTTRRPRKGQK